MSKVLRTFSKYLLVYEVNAMSIRFGILLLSGYLVIGCTANVQTDKKKIYGVPSTMPTVDFLSKVVEGMTLAEVEQNWGNPTAVVEDRGDIIQYMWVFGVPTKTTVIYVVFQKNKVARVDRVNIPPP